MNEYLFIKVRRTYKVPGQPWPMKHYNSNEHIFTHGYKLKRMNGEHRYYPDLTFQILHIYCDTCLMMKRLHSIDETVTG